MMAQGLCPLPPASTPEAPGLLAARHRREHLEVRSFEAAYVHGLWHLDFHHGYLRHRLTNAGSEGVDAVIQWVKKTARRFRYADHSRTAIHFPVAAWTSTHTKAGRAGNKGPLGAGS